MGNETDTTWGFLFRMGGPIRWVAGEMVCTPRETGSAPREELLLRMGVKWADRDPWRRREGEDADIKSKLQLSTSVGEVLALVREASGRLSYRMRALAFQQIGFVRPLLHVPTRRLPVPKAF